MSVLDNALQTLFKLGVEVKKLWKNASPNSDFRAQTLPSQNDADFILTKFSIGIPSSPNYGYLLEEIVQTGEQGVLTAPINFNNSSTQGTVHREISVNSAGISFSSGYLKTSGAPQQDNGYAIPQEIYAIKLLGGVLHKLKILASSFGREVLA